MTLWGVASTGYKADVKKLPLKGEVRRDASRQECLAWVRDGMVSHTKRSSTYGKRSPCHAISCIPTGTRGSERIQTEVYRLEDYRRQEARVVVSHLNYLTTVRDTVKNGNGCVRNRHLNHLAESINVNKGGSHRDDKECSHPMTDVSVGATIVVRARESRVHGEGSQSVGTSQANVTECQHGGISNEYR